MMRLSCRVMRLCSTCPYHEIKELQQRAWLLKKQLDWLAGEKRKIENLVAKQNIKELFIEPLCYYDGFTWKGEGERQVRLIAHSCDSLTQEKEIECPYAYGSCEGRKALQERNLQYLRRKLTQETGSYNATIQLLNHSLHYRQQTFGSLKDMYLSLSSRKENVLVYFDKRQWLKNGHEEGYEAVAFIKKDCYDQIQEKKIVLHVELDSHALEGTCCYLPKPYNAVQCVMDKSFSVQEVLVMIDEMEKLCRILNKEKSAIEVVYLSLEHWPIEERSALAAGASQIGAKAVGRIERGYGFRENKMIIKLCHKKE